MLASGAVDLATSLYRRPLPAPSIAFSSPEGRRVFQEALEAGTLEAFFPLIEQFHTQADPSFCGLGSLVMALNALGIDPGRTWRGPWRWFSEELLDCCTPLAQVQQTGLTLDEVACLARCNGARVARAAAGAQTVDELRAAVDAASRSTHRVLVAAYLRSALGQTGAGHFSPLGGYHAARDLVLLLDVARFKYPPHWVPLTALFEAMRGADPTSGRPRGWLVLEKRADASAVAQLLLCAEGPATKAALLRLHAAQSALLAEDPPATLEALFTRLARALLDSGLLEHVRLRPAADKAALLDEVRRAVEALPLHRAVARAVPGDAVGNPVSTALTIWIAAAPPAPWAALPGDVHAQLTALLDRAALPARLVPELELLRSQVEFLLEMTAA